MVARRTIRFETQLQMDHDLHADLAAAIRAALPTNPEMDPLAAAAGAGPVATPGTPMRGSFVLLGWAALPAEFQGRPLVHPSPVAGDLRRTVLQELHATPLGGHFGRDKTLSSSGQSSLRLPANARRTSAMTRVNALDLASGVVMVLRTEDERGAKRRVQSRPEGAGETEQKPLPSLEFPMSHFLRNRFGG
jgi:hypothetical protein